MFLNDVEAPLADAAWRLAAGDVVEVVDGSTRQCQGVHGEEEHRQTSHSLRRRVADRSQQAARLLSVPLERKTDADSVYDHIEGHLRSHGKRRPLVVHRIDLDTSGLVVFAQDQRWRSSG